MIVIVVEEESAARFIAFLARPAFLAPPLEYALRPEKAGAADAREIRLREKLIN